MSAPLTRSDVETAVRAAALAPSVLNIQPWRFVARGDSIELHRDPGRLLPHSDPARRSLTVSCGAALYNLRLAVAALGRQPLVTLLPDGTDPDSTLLARVDVGGTVDLPWDGADLHAAIALRRTSRMPFVDEVVAPERAIALEEAAAAEGATLRVLDWYEAYDIGNLVRDADRAQRYDSALRAEIRAWTQRDADAVDGIPVSSMGPAPNDVSTLVRDFALGLPVQQRERADFETKPLLAVLLSDRDDTADWLVAGQALERIWLEVTAAGLAMSLLMQPLELAELRWLARPPRGSDVRPASADPSAERRPYWPQALLRIGVATRPTPPTPRRPLGDILTFE